MNYRYLIFWAKCNCCGHQFEFLDEREGAKLLQNPITMQFVEIDWQKNTIFDEVGHLVMIELQSSQLTDIQKSMIFWKIFGKICDPDSNGVYYDMTGTIRCPNCGSENDSRYGPTSPPRYWQGVLPRISHKNWDALTTVEKNILVKEELLLICREYSDTTPI